MANEVATNKPKGLTTYLNSPNVRANIASVIGENAVQPFIADLVAVVQANPGLKECTSNSLLSAGLVARSLNLSMSPSMGQCYPVPYKNKKLGITEAQFQLGAKGFYQLALRSKRYKKFVFQAVHKGELVSSNPFENEYVFEPIQDPDERDAAPIVGWYAKFVMHDGFEHALYWTDKKMREYAKKYSKAYRADLSNKSGYVSSPWSTDYEGMAKKTMFKALLRGYGVLSIDDTVMRTALEADQAVIHSDDQGNVSYSYVDNQHDVVEEAHEAIEAGANTQEFMDVEFSEVPTAGEVNADNPFAEG